MTNREFLLSHKYTDRDYLISLWAKENVEVDETISDLLFKFSNWLEEEYFCGNVNLGVLEK